MSHISEEAFSPLLHSLIEFPHLLSPIWNSIGKCLFLPSEVVQGILLFLSFLFLLCIYILHLFWSLFVSKNNELLQMYHDHFFCCISSFFLKFFATYTVSIYFKDNVTCDFFEYFYTVYLLFIFLKITLYKHLMCHWGTREFNSFWSCQVMETVI